MVGLLTMTGSASLVGIWVYRRGNKAPSQREPAAKSAWWQVAWQRVQTKVWPSHSPVSPHSPSTPTTEQSFAPTRHRRDPPVIEYGLATSTLALVVTTTGQLFYPPLQVAGLPLLVYMGIPAAQEAYVQLSEEGRPSRALAETVVLAVCLASSYYWVSSLGFCLYYGGRRLLGEPLPSTATHPAAGAAPPTAHLGKEGTTQAVSTAALRPGDQVILQSGEIAPVDGLITEGVAWLRPQTLSAVTCAVRKGVGDRVAAADLIVVGEIGMQVLPMA